jgi:two-component system KDP operon response regulator KdpE
VPALTVLVVDDDPSIRLLCRLNLELAGHRVVEAGTLDDAAAAAVGERPQVVLLDVHVGSGDGVAFLAELRGLLPEVRVVMLTGTADTAAIRAAGADAIVPKPFDPVALVATIEGLAAGLPQVG